VRSICVFSGSSPGARPEYATAARALGRGLARRGLRVVYGGGGTGLMAHVADAALAADGEVIGVIPQHLVDDEVAHRGLPELRVTATMHERKAAMAELSDGFVALPGGFGTLEEFAEVVTWAQLGLHAKPCGLLDVAGYYRPLLAFFDQAVAERFVRAEYRAMVLADTDPGRLLDAMERWTPPTAGPSGSGQQRPCP
jgi:uncharacterized protein (TIGR00730 family)